MDCSLVASTQCSLRRRPVDRTVRRSCSTASYAGDSSVLEHRQLRRELLSARTSPAMSGTPLVVGHHRLHQGLLGARTSPATPGTPRSSVLGHRRLRRGLLAPRFSVTASYAGNSLVGRTSPATSRTPRCLDLVTSRRCAIKLLHAIRIRVLILGSMSGVLIRACQTMSASFQTYFSLTLLQDSFFIF